MKGKLLLVTILCAFALAACGRKAPASEGSAAAENAPAQEEAEPSKGQTAEADPSSANITVASLAGLIGKEDAEAVALLGEGTPEYGGEDMLTGRRYQLDLLGELADVSLSINLYREGDNVVEQCRIDLPQSDLQACRDQLAGLFGEPSESYENSYFFETDTAVIVLADPYGDGPYIEISDPSDNV